MLVPDVSIYCIFPLILPDSATNQSAVSEPID